MYEYITVSTSSYDPAGLAAKLTEKSSEGWAVVAIVPTGGDVTAFLSRSVGAATPAASAPAAAAVEAAPAEVIVEAVAGDSAPEVAPVETPAEAVTEPAGWAAVAEPEPEVVAPVAVAAAEPEAVVAAAAVAPAVPAGWYADPAGRFELRYWDANQWTEHVSRAGQQFTDPPVA
ncbi:MAG: DUF2510 domain-containing protein [Actinobacteria bacterium]|nr:DUF2510 domain-containing protein [Actinomycetota bacterium]